ncbi:MAG: hypothetical protein KAH99_05210 [Verrucomicrobia bacterium]|nr:hypothetical protein [Verrucomicrobiota bacterium]
MGANQHPVVALQKLCKLLGLLRIPRRKHPCLHLPHPQRIRIGAPASSVVVHFH